MRAPTKQTAVLSAVAALKARGERITVRAVAAEARVAYQTAWTHLAVDGTIADIKAKRDEGKQEQAYPSLLDELTERRNAAAAQRDRLIVAVAEMDRAIAAIGSTKAAP